MKNIIKLITENLKLFIILLISALIVGFFIGKSTNQNTTQNVHQDESAHQHIDELTNQVWTCSMHPQIKQDKPGQCPICAMDLIPLTSTISGGEDIDPNEIVMSESAAKLASIQTIKVTKGAPNKTVYLQGKIQADERNIAELTARFGGRIEKLFVNFTGQNVSKGEKLATIYSPSLVTAQRELLEAISFKESRPSLYLAAKGKLRLWDLTNDQISAIEEKGEPQLYFDVLSPISGTVMMRHVAIGDYIKEGMPLFKVVNLKQVWAMFDAYESDLPWIKLGDKIDFTIQALPGKTFSSKVSFIDPFINAQTRVTKVRLEISNPNLILKPEMFTVGLLESKIAKASNEIIVPKSSILWTGKRAVVYVKVQNRESPSFLYREVVLGPEAGSFYVISEGLTEGEEIAVNGVFKIDAASQLQGLPSMMNPGGGAGSTPHDMSKMDIGTDNKAMTEDEHNKMTTKVVPLKIPVAFKRQMTNVFKSYLNMKDAFVESDAHKVKTTANDVKASLKKIDMALLKGDAHMIWMEYLGEMEKATNSISKSMDIKKQRVEFSIFNLTFYKSLKTFGLLNDTAYYQYCPMANGDKGAYWFSESKEIRNPYFGEAMMTCGETRETLK